MLSSTVVPFDLDDTHANGISHQAGDVMNIEPFHQVSAVTLNCLDADLQGVGDLSGTVSFGNQLQDLLLPWRHLKRSR